MSVFPTKSVVLSGQNHTETAFYSNDNKLFLSKSLYGFRDISIYTYRGVVISVTHEKPAFCVPLTNHFARIILAINHLLF